MAAAANGCGEARGAGRGPPAAALEALAASPRVQCSSRSQTTSPSRLQGWLQLCRRSSADRGFARSLHKRPAGRCSAQQTCSVICMCVPHQIAPNVGGLWFATDATKFLSPESPRARRQRLVPTRCYGSGRRALPNPASLARGAARALPIEQRPSVVFGHTTPKRQMDNIMYLYEQPGPPDDAPKATAAAEDGGLGGLNWVALVLPSTTLRGRRGRPRRGEAGRRTPRFSARDCGGRS